jgi:predicted AlkP superfamily phosphohydrolase/phosphomutase
LHHPKSLLRLRDELVETTDRVADLAESFMQGEAWDLFMVGFGATHRGGHKLWDLSGLSGQAGPEEQAELRNALRDVYLACDRAIGRLVDQAGEQAAILVFSLHGMGANTSRVELLPEMLDRILSDKAARAETNQEPTSGGLLQRVRKMIPLEWRDNVKRRLPAAWQDKLTVFWRTGRVDWTTTRAFSLVADLQGYIRVNLKDREAAGIVSPGPEYDHLCQEITQGLMTFVDADTGRPVVEQIIRSDQQFEPGPCRQDLPDLVVRWANRAAADHRAIVSPRYGMIAWPVPGRNPDGRSGNHRPKGFLIARDGHSQPGSAIEDAHIIDLAPTVYGLLDLPQPGELRGRSLLK